MQGALFPSRSRFPSNIEASGRCEPEVCEVVVWHSGLSERRDRKRCAAYSFYEILAGVHTYVVCLPEAPDAIERRGQSFPGQDLVGSTQVSGNRNQQRRGTIWCQHSRNFAEGAGIVYDVLQHMRTEHEIEPFTGVETHVGNVHMVYGQR